MILKVQATPGSSESSVGGLSTPQRARLQGVNKSAMGKINELPTAISASTASGNTKTSSGSKEHPQKDLVSWERESNFFIQVKK